MNQVEPAVWFPAIRCGTGTDVFTQRLCEGLQARGIRAEICWLPHRAEYAPWTVAVPRPPSWANVVHVNTWLHPRFIPEGLPVVATLHHSVHASAFRHHKGQLQSLYHDYWIAPIERKTMRAASRVVAVSHFAATSARAVGLFAGEIEVIPNGTDVVLFSPRQHPLTQPPFRLLYVGNWATRKGVDLLDPIMRGLGDQFRLICVGGQPSKGEKDEMPDNVSFEGRVHHSTHMVALMRSSHALLFPSRSEGLSLVALEALACGLPIITTRGTSMAEIVQHGMSGMLCDEDDVASFISAIREVAAAPVAHLEMTLAARKLAVERYSQERMFGSYIHLYDGLLKV